MGRERKKMRTTNSYVLITYSIIIKRDKTDMNGNTIYIVRLPSPLKITPNDDEVGNPK